MTTKNTTELLKKLRNLMKNEGVQAYIVPSEDAHQSEYIAPCDTRRAFITGFTGSRGRAAVTEDRAGMWTDGRYFLQAAKEMDQNWTLMKERVKDTPTMDKWLMNSLAKGSRVAVDPFLISASEFLSLSKTLNAKSIQLIGLENNLVDQIWAKDRPAFPTSPLMVLPVEYSGQKWEHKIASLRGQMHENKCSMLVLSALDEIAWTLNLRGGDIAFNPVFFSYLIITARSSTSDGGEGAGVTMLIQPDKVTDAIRSHLTGVDIRDYGQISSVVAETAAACKRDHPELSIWLPGGSTSQGIGRLIDAADTCSDGSPVATNKALKNATEMQGMRNAHLRDAVAHCEFLIWLEQSMAATSAAAATEPLTELSCAAQFQKFRERQDDYVSLSFETISATGPHAALCHYSVNEETNAQLKRSDMYLVDSGGQYRDGTTDVTRTVCFDTPSEYQRECYTRVLKAHIRLAKLNFPNGTPGVQLDAVSRLDLWEAGLDFRHGVGHGVGHFLNVHEGPMSVGYRDPVSTKVGIQKDMVVTIEPGYYEDDQFGIRIENVYGVVPARTVHQFQDVEFLTFSAITLVPINKQLILPSVLDQADIKWFNDYHSEVLRQLTPLLEKQGKPDVIKWLESACSPLA